MNRLPFTLVIYVVFLAFLTSCTAKYAKSVRGDGLVQRGELNTSDYFFRKFNDTIDRVDLTRQRNSETEKIVTEHSNNIINVDAESDDTDVITFSFTGPPRDISIVRWYEFMLEYAPSMLEFRRPNWIQLEEYFGCDAESSCKNSEYVVDFYSVLGEYDNSYVDILLPKILSKFGEIVYPGLYWYTYETPSRVKASVYSSLKGFRYKKKLCSMYRIDNNADCIREEDEDFIYLNAQGLQISFKVPKAVSQELLKIYLDSYADEIDYIEGNISANIRRPVQVYSEADSLAIAMRSLVELEPSHSGVESENMRICEGIHNLTEEQKEILSNFSNIKSLRDHVNAYRNLVYPWGEPKIPLNSRFPRLAILDNFPDERDSPISHYKTAIGRHHIDQLSFESIAQDSSVLSQHLDCMGLSVGEASVDTHGVYILGFSTAQKNGLGIVGFSPGYKIKPDLNDSGYSNFLYSSIKNTDQLLNNIKMLNYNPSGQTTIVNLSIGEDFDRSIYELQNIISGMSKDVLFVVAAPNARHFDGNRILPGCTYLACLGGLDNVIVVSALDSVKATSIPKLRTTAGFGGEVVAVAAPGTNIVSFDVFKTNFPAANAANLSSGGYTSGYSIRSGSSPAAAIVSSVAVQMLTVNQSLTPAEIKYIIVNTSQPYESRDGTGKTELLRGDYGEVSGGVVNGSAAVAAAKGDFVLYEDENGIGKWIEGKIEFDPDTNRVRLFHREDYFNKADPNSLLDCPATTIYRIHRNRHNEFKISCKAKSPLDDTLVEKWKYIKGFLEIGELSAMDCMDNGQHCVSIVNEATNERQHVDFSRIKELYMRK